MPSGRNKMERHYLYVNFSSYFQLLFSEMLIPSWKDHKETGCWSEGWKREREREMDEEERREVSSGEIQRCQNLFLCRLPESPLACVLQRQGDWRATEGRVTGLKDWHSATLPSWNTDTSKFTQLKRHTKGNMCVCVCMCVRACVRVYSLPWLQTNFLSLSLSFFLLLGSAVPVVSSRGG